ncbi:MAG: leucine-rich repeat protein [Ruminococcus sp.]
MLIKYNVVISDSVTNICYYAFISCWGLKSITIPDSVISIDEGAFSNCYNLESIHYRK